MGKGTGKGERKREQPAKAPQRQRRRTCHTSHASHAMPFCFTPIAAGGSARSPVSSEMPEQGTGHRRHLSPYDGGPAPCSPFHHSTPPLALHLPATDSPVGTSSTRAIRELVMSPYESTHRVRFVLSPFSPFSHATVTGPCLTFPFQAQTTLSSSFSRPDTLTHC